MHRNLANIAVALCLRMIDCPLPWLIRSYRVMFDARWRLAPFSQSIKELLSRAINRTSRRIMTDQSDNIRWTIDQCLVTITMFHICFRSSERVDWSKEFVLYLFYVICDKLDTTNMRCLPYNMLMICTRSLLLIMLEYDFPDYTSYQTSV